MAMECHPYSSHVLVMACRELTESIASYRNVDLPLSSERFIRKEHLVEWRQATVRAYNFFKHADRDPSATMTEDDPARIEGLNDLAMLANISHLHHLGYNLHPAYSGFWVSIALIYPNLMNWPAIDAHNPEAAAIRQKFGEVSRPVVMQALRYSLFKSGLLPDDIMFKL